MKIAPALLTFSTNRSASSHANSRCSGAIRSIKPIELLILGTRIMAPNLFQLSRAISALGKFDRIFVISVSTSLAKDSLSVTNIDCADLSCTP